MSEKTFIYTLILLSSISIILLGLSGINRKNDINDIKSQIAELSYKCTIGE